MRLIRDLFEQQNQANYRLQFYWYPSTIRHQLQESSHLRLLQVLLDLNDDMRKGVTKSCLYPSDKATCFYAVLKGITIWCWVIKRVWVDLFQEF